MVVVVAVVCAFALGFEWSLFVLRVLVWILVVVVVGVFELYF